jgi:hypothetical protein
MAFLALALVLCVIGVAVVMFRHRRPRGFQSSIDDFAARRDALDPARAPRRRGRDAG